MKQRLVVIGAGMASGRALEELFKRAPDAYEVTLFGAEPRGNYNRIMLSPVLSGEKSFDEIVTHDVAWYVDNKVTCRFGEPVLRIDRDRKVILTAGGETPYDKLIVATGSNPFIIPIPGHNLPGVISYRDLDDTNAMIKAAEKPGAKAVVIGGGLLGLEAAAGLKMRGMDVTVVHLMGHLMERQLDEAAGYLLRKELVGRGIKVMCSSNSKEIYGDGKVEGLRLDDGTELPADILVMAVGIRPNTQIAKDAGLTVGRGIQIDDQCLTSDADIFALGECVEHNGATFGLVAPIFDMAMVLGATLAGEEAAYVPKPVSTKLKVTGVDLFSAGNFAEAEDREDIIFRDPARGVYKRLVLQDNKILGAVMYGDTTDGNWFFDHINDATDVAEMRETLIFGPAYQGGDPLDPMAAVAALPDEAEICGCNGVSTGEIEQTIKDAAKDLGGVRTATKASGSGWTCKGLREEALAASLGHGFATPAAQQICDCTDPTLEDARRLIKSYGLKTKPALWQELSWKTGCGCDICDRALNFYPLADGPLEYKDDPQGCFVNERNHANIQKDGTVSLVPRKWGDTTNPRELRATAAEKYSFSKVKVTGGHRIDLLGVKKNELPGIEPIWAKPVVPRAVLKPRVCTK